MYEYNGETRGPEQNNSFVVSEVSENVRKKEEKKANRKSFFRKVGTGLCVGLAFGLVAGASFEAVTRVSDLIFPDKKNVSAEAGADEDNKTSLKMGGQNDADKPESGKAKEIPSTKVAENDDESDAYTASTAAVGMDVSGIVENAMPSIVSITNKSVQEVRSMFGMGVQEYESTAAGSGIIIGQNDDELLIVTNYHVIEGANELTVGFIDDEVYSAYVKGSDEDMDIAVIGVKASDIKDSTLGQIKVATVGDSDDLLVGEQVVAIGNALGYGQSVTTGIVSALDRDVTEDNIDNPLIQTDAAINPGNSGGALLNMNGELIGINCAKIASTSIEGVGYAIPIDTAIPTMETLMNRETREKVDDADAGYVGITGVSVDSSTSEAYGIPEGVYIQTVEEGSPAEKAGLIKTDVVRKFDGITVSSISDIRDNLDYYKAGETIDLQIYRLVDGEYVEKTISITLGSREGTALDPANKADETESDDAKGNNGNDKEGQNNTDENPFGDGFGFFGY